MDSGTQDEIEDLSSSPPPPMGSMQITGNNNGFVHNIDFMAQTYLRNRSSAQIDIQEDTVKMSNATPGNPVKSVMSKMVSQSNSEHDDYKQILKGITGSIGPGEILALMGPSGSGKTTLLKVIGGRLRENVKGTVTYNEVPYSPALKRRIGFVTQDDVLYPQLTVEETLIFAAFLRLSSSMSPKQKYDRVEVILKELGLERCRKTRVGGGFISGISGGERKRTSIGYEILVDPSLLLLDEPTSGLDSTSANKLIQILRENAKVHYNRTRGFTQREFITLCGFTTAGRTIITTIHQPSSKMFHMFDKILLISEGHPMYYGKARESMSYFSSLRFIPDIAMNPAEFLLDLATGQVNDISTPDDITELETKEKEANHRTGKAPEHLRLAIQVKKDWTISWWDQFLILFKRTYRERWRDYFDTLRIGLLFYVCIFWTSSSIFGAVYVFPFEKFFLVKERKADMYRLSAYYVCSTLCDMIAHVTYPTVFMLILYFMVGFKKTLRCFSMTFTFTSQDKLLIISQIGFRFFSLQHIPKFMQWLKYISFMYHGFRLLLKVQYSGDELYECESAGGCRPLQSSPSFDTVNLKGGWKEVWMLLGMGLVYRLLAYICLRRKISQCNI
ncbi:AAA+ ATPase domain-containing protein [Cynara cardunculus var. scolymus]|uniref:AAA+ ATPase domain-containing protein n=1 Tax=Cynara cardunculus var. scolymus TaxID=59895 RepID=A0A103YJP4_CYNCS|nr:AAA+ ATPase domain-containing protein [Cynara cardunculus var. scolymus]